MASATSNLLLHAKILYNGVLSMLFVFFGGLLPNLAVPPHDLTGKTAIVTGANSGIGYQLALDLAKSGATVYLACRNLYKAQQAADNMQETLAKADKKSWPGKVAVMELDTSSMKSVRAFATSWQENAQESRQIDLLVHNAGISSPVAGKEITEDGFEAIYATNFLGSFVLTALLEKDLAPKARVLFTSSGGQYAGDFNSLLNTSRETVQPSSQKRIPNSQKYSDSKFMQVAFARLLQKRWNSTGEGLVAHAFAPGYILPRSSTRRRK